MPSHQDARVVARLDLPQPAHVVEFCPHPQAEDLIAWGGDTIVGVIRKTQTADGSQTTFTLVEEHLVGARATAISWSPSTTFSSESQIIRLVVGCDNGKIFLIDQGRVLLVGSHLDTINDLSFSFTEKHTLASVSEDQTLCIWTLPDNLHHHEHGSFQPTCATSRLSSPGVAVRSHPDRSNLFMVAEKSGIVRFYDFRQDETVWSVLLRDDGPGPAILRDADWSIEKSLLRFGAVIGSKWYIWDFPHLEPIRAGHGHEEGAHQFRWARNKNGETVFATATSAPSADTAASIKVHNIDHQLPVHVGDTSSKARVTSISWHRSANLLASANRSRLLCHSIQSGSS
ncbi:WD40-repeat-containing domain protein [Polychytrium aggregatum]|uniref:WD40-repeat-containing domain protein n=1 Tax=Polychytrium aggregatum TaxID=110093 RepID=UPI0022FE9BD0|nr:WD40-repeat-containing domain protein [Polychytrium aggregatum]KAI9199343.1 WD40-repeat-containing domain protein [Polychytrium aggregatum]